MSGIQFPKTQILTPHFAGHVIVAVSLLYPALLGGPVPLLEALQMRYAPPLLHMVVLSEELQLEVPRKVPQPVVLFVWFADR